MNLRNGFFRLTICVSVSVTAVSFYFLWRDFPLFRPVDITDVYWGFFHDDLAKTIGCSLMCGGVVWVIYFLAKFVVEGFIGGEENQK